MCVLLLDEAADDGFDSETVTPVSNDYYNSSEQIWLKQDQYDVTSDVTKPSSPARGNSESLGSLSTDASDRDYYNDFHPLVKSDQMFLNNNGTATSEL